MGVVDRWTIGQSLATS